MGRPTVISDEVADAIAYVAKPGMSVRAVHALVSAAGIDVSQATVARHLRRTRAEPAPAPAPKAAGAAPPAMPAAPADELTGLESQLASVDAALAQWQPTMGADKSAVLAFARLVEVKKGVLKAIDELRPRASAEAERLLVLGHAAKAELLERVRARAAEDERLRAIVARQREVIADLVSRVGT